MDARPTIAMAMYIASIYLLTQLLGYIGYGVQPLASWWLYLPAAGAAALAAAGIWRLRHQAAL